MRRLAVLLSSLVLLGAGQIQPHAELLQILTSIAHFDDAGLIAISYWASDSNPQAPDAPLTDLDQVEIKTLTLPPGERDALVTWLNHGGRAKLYALGITDADIGPCQPLIDPKDCRIASTPGLVRSSQPSAPPLSTSGEQRDLAFHTASDTTAESGISVEGGFASVSSNASVLTHCISFRNTTQKTAAAITLTYKLLSQSGDVITAGSDILVGSFTAGEEISSPGSFAQFQSAQSTGHSPSACWVKSSNPSDPMLQQAASFVVEVASVTFEDGTHWSL